MRIISSASSAWGRSSLRTRSTLGSAMRCGSSFVSIPLPQPDTSIDKPFLNISLNPPTWNEVGGYSYLQYAGLLGFGARGIFLGGFRTSDALELGFSDTKSLFTMTNLREDIFTLDRERQELTMTKTESGSTATVFLGDKGMWLLESKVQQAILIAHGFDIPGIADGSDEGICIPSFSINRYPATGTEGGISLKLQTNSKGDRVKFTLMDFSKMESRKCQFLLDQAVWMVRNVGGAWIDGAVEMQGDSPYGSDEPGDVLNIQELSPTEFQVSIGDDHTPIVINDFEMKALEAVTMCQFQALTRANFLDNSYQERMQQQQQEEEEGEAK